MRERRRAILWSQAELANRVGCTRVTINRIERNRAVPSFPLMVGLARALGVPGDFLYTVVDE
ncbi:MAG TPA: helix-turn-helix transcriptional regulator [Polyangia bacterium]|nr:helix-turn-helix transcriptional regulator [Polyangia bacterium]HUW17350.1 helix-turn-helix transcriptional regulator [Actinomycetes bacterium]